MPFLPLYTLMIASLAFLLCVPPSCLSQSLPPDIVPQECLVLPRVGLGGRSPIHTDAIERAIVLGTWTRPQVGDTVTLPDGKTQMWKRVALGKEGAFQEGALAGGYACVP